MSIDNNKVIEAINQLSEQGEYITLTSLSRATGYIYQSLYQSEYGFLNKGWSLKKRNKQFWLINEKLGLSTKIRVESLHNGGFWFIHQKDEKHPFMTCNPAYLKIYGHLFISCVFVKVQ